jgi:hypothetical protein
MHRRSRSFEATRAILHGVREVSLRANLMSVRAAVALAKSGAPEDSEAVAAALALARTTRELAQTMAAEMAAVQGCPEPCPSRFEQIRQLVERIQCLAAPVDGDLTGHHGRIEEASRLAETATRQIASGRDM